MDKMTIVVDKSELSRLYRIFNKSSVFYDIRRKIYIAYNNITEKYVLVFNRQDIILMSEHLPNVGMALRVDRMMVSDILDFIGKRFRY